MNDSIKRAMGQTKTRIMPVAKYNLVEGDAIVDGAEDLVETMGEP